MVRSRRSTFALLAALWVAAPIPGAAQVIAGLVIDASSGGGVARALVTAAPVGRRGVFRTQSAADGRYSLQVSAGRYVVRAVRAGYQARTSEVSVGAADTARVDLRVAVAARMLGPVAASTRPRRLPVSGVFTPVYPTDSLIAAERTRGEGGRGRVIVRGVMLTPTPCWRPAGAADRVGPLITLNIQARLTGGACPPDAVGATTYKVTLRGIPPGTYTVRVLHTYRHDAFPGAVAIDSAGIAVR
ncbi:MAG TPA: carboxypeptidase-like regulatory domain-containing protein [Longimicrobium sp.]|nr:carboxypeptidase-like regulatory domain-containing protein [Longimicrobium sp.]